MCKKILVLTGSARRGGNSDLMADAFIKGAAENGHTITKFETAFKTIGGCRACDACWSKGTACSFQDDFSELQPLLESADVIVYATPLYWFSFPAQMKASMDKLYAYMVPHCKTKLSIKECFLLTCGENEGINIFNGIKQSYLSIADYMGWEDRGILAIPGVFEKGKIMETDALIKAEAMGKSFK